MLKEVSYNLLDRMCRCLARCIALICSIVMQSEETCFISDFLERVVPFLSRLDKLQPGTGKQCLVEYMITAAKVSIHTISYYLCVQP